MKNDTFNYQYEYTKLYACTMELVQAIRQTIPDTHKAEYDKLIKAHFKKHKISV